MPRCFVRAAFRARRTSDTVVHVGLDSGSVYVGYVGHPDYARMDILGQAVFGAFNTERWASRNTQSHVAATASVVEGLADTVPLVETGTISPLVPKATPPTVYGLQLPG